ncbi:MAG: ABC transporter permease [Deltaproteobacteria bacterium]|nr:ABC transporter permease [Deltaproteobacteria bacterium]
MKNIWLIAWKDLKGYFVTPIGYLVLTVFTVLMSWMFFSSVSNVLMSQQYGRPAPGDLSVVMQPVLGNMAVIFLLMGSLLTMRLIAEERKMHTLELIFTSPLRPIEIVFGKYLAALLFYGVMLAITLIYPLILKSVGTIHLSQVFAGYLGVFLLGASFLSLGLFISALTENQITAAAVTFGLFLFFWIIAWITGPSDSVAGKLISYVSIIDHLSNFIRGLIDTQDVIYYLSFIFFGLFLTTQAVESQRWR